jgi:hypothetical protein
MQSEPEHTNYTLDADGQTDRISRTGFRLKENFLRSTTVRPLPDASGVFADLSIKGLAPVLKETNELQILR